MSWIMTLSLSVDLKLLKVQHMPYIRILQLYSVRSLEAVERGLQCIKYILH